MIWRKKRRDQERALAEARASRRQAEAQLEAARAETPKYRALGESLRQLREANNFAAAIETSFRGGK